MRESKNGFMNILLINVPSRKGSGGLTLPLGLLYLGGIIEKCGHRAKIIDPYLDDVNIKDFNRFFEKIDTIIEEYKPSIIGYGGIATSYGRTKKLSLHIKSKHPKIMQVVGGPLASVYELLLTKTKVDVVFHGETEVSFPLFLKKAEKEKQIHDVPGISFLLDGKIMRNDPAEQIKNLDKILFPAYHLIDMSQYLQSSKERLDTYKPLIENNPNCHDVIDIVGTKTYYIPIIASRGCTNRCSFCYRHVQGIRRHSVGYVINHIKFLKKKYGISGFQFCDELFNSSYEWVMELCDAIQKNKLDIFFMIGGARADKIDENILRQLKRAGCIEIAYGQESGSDTILKEYRKGVTSQKNKETTLLTKKVGLISSVQLVVGSPSETTSTICETIQLLKDVNAYQYSLNYLIPLPETPIWEYVKENKLIEDVEHYLDLVAEYGGAVPLINLTKEPDKVWKSWGPLVYKEVKSYYYKKTKLKYYYYHMLLFSIVNATKSLIPHRMKILIPRPVKRAVMKLLQ